MGCAQEPAGTVTVPLEVLDTGHIALKARINGKGPFRMILDTGAPICLINPKAAERAGMITKEEAKQPPILLGLTGMGVMHSLDVGDVHLKDVNAMVMDHPIVALLADVEGPLDGILGFTFFAHYRMTLDYAAGTVSFSPVDYVPTDIFGSLLGRMMSDDAPGRVIDPAALWGMAVAKPDDAPGVRITKVYRGGAAEAAGLRVGDRLLTLDGRWTDSVNDCDEAAAFVKPGETVTLKIARDGHETEISASPQAGL
jgi:hypothetical protein